MGREEPLIADLVFIVLFVLLPPAIFAPIHIHIITEGSQEPTAQVTKYFAPEVWLKISGTAAIIALLYSIGNTITKTFTEKAILALLTLTLTTTLLLYAAHKAITLANSENLPEKITLFHSVLFLTPLPQYIIERLT